MTKRKDLNVAWQALLVTLTVAPWLLGGCGGVPSVRAFNGSFTLGLEGWEIHPADRASVVGEDRILNVAMSSSGKASVLKVVPLDPETEFVKISFKVRHRQDAIAWTKREKPSFQLNLEDPPGTGGVARSAWSRGQVNPQGDWQSHEMVKAYRPLTYLPGHAVTVPRTTPSALVVKIIVDEGTGSLQFDDFRVQQIVTRVMIEHR
jgi:hypothetical protein